MADTLRDGFLRDGATLALVTVYPAGAVKPYATNNGFVVDATGALLITPPGASP